MKKILLLLGVLFLAQNSFAYGAKLIGHTALHKKIFTRVFDPQNELKNFSLADLYYFEETPHSFKNYIGYYESNIDNDGIKNGEPNSFNFILLSILADNIASTVTETCNDHRLEFPVSEATKLFVVAKPDLNNNLKSIISRLCSWPLVQTNKENLLLDLFYQITVFDYSTSEGQAWLQHFMNKDYELKSNQEVIYEMVYTLILNPHFLLKK